MNTKGTITPAIVVITGTFVIVIYGLLFVLNLQLDYSHRQVASEQALNIAEAGVNYYRWHLAHDPTDYQDGSGEEGPYEHEYTDPQGSPVGKYSLQITPPNPGSSMTTISSTGWTYQYPRVKRKVTVQYGQQSPARFSFLQHESSWYGNNITINGMIHSNNGIRMDGTNLSLVTSAQETYTCGSETGCSPSQTRPGVWGSGGDQGLWQFPVPQIDFNSIYFDFANMRTKAQEEGLYLGPSGSFGYRLVFQNDGSMRVSRVNSTGYIRGYDPVDGCQNRYQLINSETLIGTYYLSATPIVFAEDHLWVEGTVNGRITVVAARFPVETNNMNIWIPNNIQYAQDQAGHVLGLIAQNNIYFTRDVSENFRIDAAMMAQGGRIMRHGYYASTCGYHSTHTIKDRLIINGTMISYQKSYWNYGSTNLVSGFTTRNINYDPSLLYFPPPYFPTSGDYEFVSWVEE